MYKSILIYFRIIDSQVLDSKGYQIQKRGLIDVKGKGAMETYFVLGKASLQQEGTSKHRSTCRSLAAVVYGVVQARRKQRVDKSVTVKVRRT